MNTLEDLLRLNPEQLQANWNEIDRIVRTLPSRIHQIRAWEQVCKALDKSTEETDSLKGHPFFRLGILHLIEDREEQTGLEYLELAYKEDQRYAVTAGTKAEERAAYRLLAIVKDFFAYLRFKKPQDWERALLLDKNRRVMIPLLFTVYDLSTIHALDMPGFTTVDFLKLIKNDKLRIFAGENYFCTQHLLVMYTLANQHVDKHNDQYPLGRAIVGLIGGVLEAIWLDRLPGVRVKTLGGVLREAHQNRILQPDTKIAALSSLLCFMRNHVHPDRDAQRLNYFIDMNVAKGCKVALDMTIADLLTTS